MVALLACNACEPSLVEPAYDACPNIAEDQPSVPEGMMKNSAGDCVDIPRNVVTNTIELPTGRDTVITGPGRSIACKFSSSQENAPTGSVLVDSLFLDGKSMRCETLSGVGVKSPELVQGSPPAPVGALSVGEHTLTLKSCNTTSKVCATTTVKFPVAEWPTKIVYTWVKASYPNSGPRVFCILDDDGGGQPVCQTEESQKYWPMLTPDGRSWMYSKLDYSGLWFSNLDGSGARAVLLSLNGKTILPEAPEYSPDGKKIAFVGVYSGTANYSAFVMNADGSGLKQVWADCETLKRYIAWMPNSQEIVTGCTTDRDEYRKINVETGGYKVLLVAGKEHEARKAFVQDVSPDGKWGLLWSGFTGGDALLLSADGLGIVKEILSPTPDQRVGCPLFCERGKRICYQYGPSLFSMNLDGADVKNIITLPSGWIETPRGWNK